MKQTHPFLIAFIILLFGCTPTDYEEATVTNEPEAVARRVTATPNPPTSTAEPSPTIISVMQETPTKEVRNVLVREDNGTPRPMITRRPTPIFTPTLTDPEIGATVVAIQSPREYDSYVSPDGRKRAEVIVYDCIEISSDKSIYGDYIPQYGVEQFNLVNLDDGGKTMIDEQLSYCGMPDGGFRGLFWSENSRYFYYTDERVGAPGGGAYGWSRPFSVYDSVKRVTMRLGAGELSHDGTKLAFWDGQWPSMSDMNPTPMLVVWDVNEGRELSRLPIMSFMDDLNIKRKNVFEGYMAWSPDQNELAYIVVDDDWGSVTHVRRSAVIRVDLDQLTQQVILETEAPLLQWIEWDDPEQLTLFVSPRENEWVYDLETGDLTEIPPAHHGLFDRLVGRPVTTVSQRETEKYSLDFTVYTFETAEMATEMAGAIRPNGTLIMYTTADGTEMRETIVPDVGTRPYWWHVDDKLYLYMDWRNDTEDIAQISLELEARPLTNSTGGAVNLRIANGQKDHLLDSVPYDKVIEEAYFFLGIEDVVYDERNVPFGEMTGYKSGGLADFHSLSVTINGVTTVVTRAMLQAEERLPSGNYTIVLDIRNNGTIIPELILDGYSY